MASTTISSTAISRQSILHRSGTKVAAHYRLTLRAEEAARLRLRLAPTNAAGGLEDFDTAFRQRRAEADEFYAALQQDMVDPDVRLVQRQAFAGMLWTKQFYHIDIPQWLDGDPLQPAPPASRRHGRNADWVHLNNADVISVPDKWEYPWYAAWDLAFHCVTLALIDPEFAKSQLVLLTREWYMHPNGQLPAYEWAFGDVNPPVHAWAAWRVYEIDREQRGGKGDRAFLERVFHKLMLNFTWWVNRKDVEGRNIFQGGFLGLDNIGIFDRSAPLPTGGTINQSDGTAWMAMYTLNLMRIALELALEDHVYEDIASKFFEHFLYHRRSDDQYRRRRHRPVGRRGRVLLRCPAPAGRRARSAAGALDGRADPALCRRGARCLGVCAIAGFQRPDALVSRPPSAPRAARLAMARGQRRASAICCRCCADIA